MVVASAYQPYDSKDPPPTKELKALVRYCTSKGLKLLVGCDANSHHTVWGSSDTNRRGVALPGYLTLERRKILNRGSKPTFINFLRREVIDLTLCISKVVHMTKNGKVRKEDILSDHRRISFYLDGDAAWEPTVMYRNPRATDWTSYREELAKGLRGPCCKLKTIGMVEGAVGTLQTVINQAFEAACPARQRKCSKKVTWALKTGTDSKCEAYKATQKTYKKKIEKSKEEGWRDFCSKTENLSLVARLRKVFTSGPLINLDGLTLPNGRTAENQTEILTHMLETHFPGSLPAGGGLPIRVGPTRAGRGMMDWKTAAEIVTPDRTKWAIDTFDKFKSPGADGIFPAILQ
ncbi:uncharacterized protein LOC125500690 [Athalia rosae]|uniref:uncharacterized protein LOC125500690 n=1 Tax=Athalia rosae TaxID=37344 RepID=UPI002033AC7D|nr:uncharacterized protein LOC125500690 [Athalia rosae]